MFGQIEVNRVHGHKLFYKNIISLRIADIIYYVILGVQKENIY
jgi:hypothetical protein